MGIESQQTFHDFAQLNPFIACGKMTLKGHFSDCLNWSTWCALNHANAPEEKRLHERLGDEHDSICRHVFANWFNCYNKKLAH